MRAFSGRSVTVPRIAVVVKAVVRAADAWGLTNVEGAALFDVPTATWSRMKAGSYRGILDQDKVTRASLIVGFVQRPRVVVQRSFGLWLAEGSQYRPRF